MERLRPRSDFCMRARAVLYKRRSAAVPLLNLPALSSERLKFNMCLRLFACAVALKKWDSYFFEYRKICHLRGFQGRRYAKS